MICLFMWKYYHLHEEYLKSKNNAKINLIRLALIGRPFFVYGDEDNMIASMLPINRNYRNYSFIKDIQMMFCTVLGRKMEYAAERI